MAAHAAPAAESAASVRRHGPCSVRADAVCRCVWLRHQQPRRSQLQDDVRLLPESAAAATCIAIDARATPKPTVVPSVEATSAVSSAIVIAAPASTSNDNAPPITLAPIPRV